MLSTAQLQTAKCRPLEGEQAMSAADIAAQLAATPAWQHADGYIKRTFSFGNYYETMAFLNAIAWVIHQEDHHPDITFGYNKAHVGFNTHSVNGISLNDFICAAKLDAIYGK